MTPIDAPLVIATPRLCESFDTSGDASPPVPEGPPSLSSITKHSSVTFRDTLDVVEVHSIPDEEFPESEEPITEKENISTKNSSLKSPPPLERFSSDEIEESLPEPDAAQSLALTLSSNESDNEDEQEILDNDTTGSTVIFNSEGEICTRFF